MENNQDRKRATNDEEERKQAAARRVPLAELNQTHSDFAVAMALQEQDNAHNHNMLTRIGSDSEEDEAESEESEEDLNDYEYFESQELEFVEGEDSNSEDDMEEDDIDPDELSYEELLALGEFIGEAKRGLSASEIPKCLHQLKYTSMENKNGIDRCVICQVEYEGDEDLVALSCDHPYHSECIINWLQIKKVCPICTSEVSSSKIN
ncbi:RING/U-box superfamily protein [Euphorbia peplus]|nr:RING/U-box superfamily protein [Euphorbia peplus]